MSGDKLISETLHCYIPRLISVGDAQEIRSLLSWGEVNLSHMQIVPGYRVCTSTPRLMVLNLSLN